MATGKHGSQSVELTGDVFYRKHKATLHSQTNPSDVVPPTGLCCLKGP